MITKHRRGISLLEVTIATMLAGVVSAMAASVAFDLSRGMSQNIAQAQIASEARLAIESLRRDLSGSSHDMPDGDPKHGQLVGKLIPSQTELRLCFDGDENSLADWIAPDRVIQYVLDGSTLTRNDFLSGNVYTVARHVDSVQFLTDGITLSINLDFEFGGVTETYTFQTSDLP